MRGKENVYSADQMIDLGPVNYAIECKQKIIRNRKRIQIDVGSFHPTASRDCPARGGIEKLKSVLGRGGDRGWLHEEIFQEIERSPAQRYIRYAGYIPDAERGYYYSAASAFVYPSFFEGFGFPVLEAMACGTPVVTAHNSSLPEVAGDAALLVDPYNVSDIAAGLKMILTDSSLCERLTKKGFARVKEFSWNRTVEQTLAILTR